ncbi:hypothetical protein [Streptomyces sp. NBC_00566]|uniref:hypothetical protein n=1 Tax=Streptomyces sp. NBC_00566 TaxID=2975778 RepID=UPI002E813DF9|nr:hypothetical protein [Streptomyces sp. NBC_00566]WUB88272.1 hypothetical protein OG812_17485 [Streptomyces sp. NBC_00566]
MPKVQKTPDILQRLAVLEEQVADLRRSGREQGELPFFPTSLRGLVYEDGSSFTTTWETILSPRTAALQLGMVFIGDVVSSTNTGGAWQVVLNDTTVISSGTVPATFAFQIASLTVDLTPYLTASQLKVQIQTRRTSGSTTGGKWGGGGSIGSAPRYARLL